MTAFNGNMIASSQGKFKVMEPKQPSGASGY